MEIFVVAKIENKRIQPVDSFTDKFLATTCRDEHISESDDGEEFVVLCEQAAIVD